MYIHSGLDHKTYNTSICVYACVCIYNGCGYTYCMSWPISYDIRYRKSKRGPSLVIGILDFQ